MINLTQASKPKDTPLPPLREELQLLPGSPLLGGAPSWMIYDPVQARFFQVGIEIFELLSLWSLGSATALIESAQARLGRQVEPEEVIDTIEFLSINSLTRDSASGSYRDFLVRKRSAERSWLIQAIHSYLFFRIPLVRPAAFLNRTMPLVNFLFRRATAVLIGVITLLALYLVSRQWDVFLSQFSYLFSFAGVTIYLLSLIVVKTLHELGHAYVATRYGVRVPSMGVAFMVMFPVLYTDTTDAWRLRSTHQRAHIDAAGVMVELAIAGLATFVWVFLEDGPLRSAVFALATTSWILSLLVNLNPFMRFDGYYLLADSIGAPNLQPRSFALARWHLRETLFGLGKTPPEPRHHHRGWMILYGYSVWVYRFFLFLGIALLVYAFFFKALGIILFALEILWFIAFPIMSEVKFWWRERAAISRTGRSKLSLGVLLVLVGILFIPWSGGIQVPAVLTAADSITIYSKHPARLTEIHIQPGMQVDQGDALFTLISPQLNQDLMLIEREIALLRSRMSRSMADEKDKAATIVLNRQLDAAQAKQIAVLEKLDELRIKAKFTGIVTDVDPELHVGQWVNPELVLGSVVDLGSYKVQGYVSESDLSRISTGQSGVFIPNNLATSALEVHLTSIAGADNQTVDIPYLASIYGGEVSVHENQEGLIPVKAAYLVEFSIDNPINDEVQQVLPGTVKLAAEHESLAHKIWRAIARVTVRELGV